MTKDIVLLPVFFFPQNNNWYLKKKKTLALTEHQTSLTENNLPRFTPDNHNS